MSVDTSSGDGEPVSIEAIAKEMTEDRAALLAAVAQSDDDGIKKEGLRRDTGVPSGSIFYHMDALCGWGLVEVVGSGDADGGIPPNIYDITERGQEFLDRSGTRTFASAEEARALRERVEELEQENETLRESFNHMADVVENLIDENDLTRSV